MCFFLCSRVIKETLPKFVNFPRLPPSLTTKGSRSELLKLENVVSVSSKSQINDHFLRIYFIGRKSNIPHPEMSYVCVNKAIQINFEL